MEKIKYRQIQKYLKSRIQQGVFKVGEYLPSENELCLQFSITRTTVRKALEELIKEGFIEKQHGKGSRVRERRQSLGLLSVKGFSEAVGDNVKTVFIQKPVLAKWDTEIVHYIADDDKNASCYYFERLRFVGNTPVMHERNWMASIALPSFQGTEFVDASFFKTLSQIYFIEITGSTQELRAESADIKNARLLNIEEDAPILHISIKFFTSSPKLTIYSELYCHTSSYPVSNSYFL